MRSARDVLIELLADEFGAGVEQDEHGVGRLTAHGALRAVEYVLDRDGLATVGSMEALTTAHRQAYYDWEVDDDAVWPPPVEQYVAMIERVLDLDLATIPAARGALIRFAAPIDEVQIGCIKELIGDFGYNDPPTWRIQRCVGRLDIRQDCLDDELDRFVAHWDHRRDHPNPWQEISRADAITHLVKLQREPLLSAGPGYHPTPLPAAHDRVDTFLYCFGPDTRYFTNGSFRLTDAAMDTGVVLLSSRLAGLWWHAEGLRGIAL